MRQTSPWGFTQWDSTDQPKFKGADNETVGTYNADMRAIDDALSTHNHTGNSTQLAHANLSGIAPGSSNHVTNGDAHNHIGGDGAAISESALSLTAGSVLYDVTGGRHGFAPAATNDLTKYLRADGVWAALPEVPTTPEGSGSADLYIGIASSAGDSSGFAKADHVHRLVDATGNPQIVDIYDGSGSPGTSIYVARSDHKHALVQGIGRPVKYWARQSSSQSSNYNAGWNFITLGNNSIDTISLGTVEVGQLLDFSAGIRYRFTAAQGSCALSIFITEGTFTGAPLPGNKTKILAAFTNANRHADTWTSAATIAHKYIFSDPARLTNIKIWFAINPTKTGYLMPATDLNPDNEGANDWIGEYYNFFAGFLYDINSDKITQL